METISPLASDIHIIYYMCVCVCVCYNTRFSGQLQLPPLSDFTKYVLRSGVGKNYPLRPAGNRVHFGLSEVAVSRQHAHTQLCHGGSARTRRRQRETLLYYYYLTKVPTAARLFYYVHNYCGDGDRDHGPRRRRSRPRRLTPSIIRQH